MVDVAATVKIVEADQILEIDRLLSQALKLADDLQLHRVGAQVSAALDTLRKGYANQDDDHG